MRRGTEPAIEFGKWLCERRQMAGMTMGKVAIQVGVPAATISQIEKGQRAFKNEAWIEPWAKAVKCKVWAFRSMKDKFDKVPVGPVIRRRGQSIPVGVLEALISDMTGPERTRVQGYIEAIIESR